MVSLDLNCYCQNKSCFTFWGKEKGPTHLSEISVLYIFGYKLYTIQSKMQLVIRCLTITEMLTFEKNGQQ